MLPVADPVLRALAEGETIVAFVPRGALTEGDEIELAGAGPLPAADLKPAYRRWARQPAPEGYSAVVASIDPAAILDPEAGAARYVLSSPGDGDIALLRVFGPTGPVLSDVAFTAKRRSVEGALQQ